ncbi:MAG: hypothetical protein J0H69_11180 [Burkholderiales bacterium]|nr:hypothetical protein [Burkholderiales bacterium]
MTQATLKAGAAIADTFHGQRAALTPAALPALASLDLRAMELRDPFAPHAVYGETHVNTQHLQGLVKGLQDHIRRAMATLPSEDATRVANALRELTARVADGTFQRLDAAGRTDALQQPSADADIWTRAHLQYAALSALTQEWKFVEQELRAVIRKNAPGPAFDDASEPYAAAESRRTESLPPGLEYLRVLAGYCADQARYSAAANMAPTTLVAATDLACDLETLRGKRVDLPIGTSHTRNAQYSLGASVKMDASTLGLSGRAAKVLSSDLGVSGGGGTTTTSYKDIDGDFNRSERRYGVVGANASASAFGQPVGAAVSTQVVGGTYAELRDFKSTVAAQQYEAMHCERNAADMLLNFSLPPPLDRAANWLVGGSPTSEAVRAASAFSPQTYEGAHLAYRLHRQAAQLDAARDKMPDPQGGILPRPLRSSLADLHTRLMPLPWDYNTKVAEASADELGKRSQFPDIGVPKSTPAAASAKHRPTQQDPEAWKLQTSTFSAGVGPMSVNPKSYTLGEDGKPVSSRLPALGGNFELSHQSSQLQLTRLNRASCDLPAFAPAKHLIALQDAVRALVDQTAPGAPGTVDAPFGEAGCLTSLHSVLPRHASGADKGRPLVDVTQPLLSNEYRKACATSSLYGDQEALHPYFRQLLQQLEVGIHGEDPGEGLRPADLLAGLRDAYPQLQQQWLDVCNDVARAKGAAAAGDGPAEEAALARLNRFATGSDASGKIDLHSLPADKNRLYLLCQQLVDLSFNMTDRLFTMAKFQHDMSGKAWFDGRDLPARSDNTPQAVPGSDPPSAWHRTEYGRAQELMHDVQQARDHAKAAMDRMQTSQMELHLCRSHLVMPSADSVSETTTATGKLTARGRPGDILRLESKPAERVPDGTLLFKELAELGIEVSWQRRQHLRHPAGHRTQEADTYTFQISGSGSVASATLQQVLKYVTEQMGNEGELRLDELARHVRQGLTRQARTVGREDGALSVLGTRHGLSLTLRRERPLPRAGEPPLPFKTSWITYGAVDDARTSMGLPPIAATAMRNAMGGLSLSPTATYANNRKEGSFVVGSSLRALMTYFSTLADCIRIDGEQGIDRHAFRQALEKSENTDVLASWFRAGPDPFLGVLRDVLKSEDRVAQGGPVRTETEYVMRGSAQDWEDTSAVQRHVFAQREANYSAASAYQPAVQEGNMFERIRDIVQDRLAPLFSQLLGGEPYTGAASQNERVLDKLAELDASLASMRPTARLRHYTDAAREGWDGPAVLTAVTEIMKELASHSNAERMGDAYRPRSNDSAIQYLAAALPVESGARPIVPMATEQPPERIQAIQRRAVESELRDMYGAWGHPPELPFPVDVAAPASGPAPSSTDGASGAESEPRNVSRGRMRVLPSQDLGAEGKGPR